MIKSLSGSELLEAKQLSSSILDDDRMFSREWMSGDQKTVVPVNAFFPSSPSVNQDAQRLVMAINECFASEIIVALIDPLCDSQAIYSGSKLIDSGIIDAKCLGFFTLHNDRESLEIVFNDILFIGGVLITDYNASFALLHDLPAEHYVVAGTRTFVEQSLGMSVDEAWAEWDESVASIMAPKEKQYFTDVGEKYRNARKT